MPRKDMLIVADPRQLTLSVQTLLVIGATLLLTLSSYAEVPMWPVPMTLQTLAVTVIGAALGWRLAVIAVMAWLAEAALGLPVLADGKAGVLVFVGATAGYLAAFPLAALLCGWLAERGWNGKRPLLAVLSMLSGNLLCLALGGAWLAVQVGPAQALTLGVAPFLVGAMVKSLAGGAILKALSYARPA
jgi:biotin transport system substrate-specific component